MLQLQRASAGSGKTYTLARKFIEYFISVKEEGGARRLRTRRELRDSLTHILAITFTNKATNEMKLRIVAKLDALGAWTPATPVGEVDYLADFAKEFGVAPEEIARVCRDALAVLLTDYGDFKVSTIDSFFQTVLRTFAFEADIDDTYQIELDSDYVARIGLDTTLDSLDTSEKKSQGHEWIGRMISEQSESGNRGWNVFQKKENSGIYANILKASRNLSKEDFKEIRDELDEYFEKNTDFFSTFDRLKSVYDSLLQASFDKMRSKARQLLREFADLGLDIRTDGGQYLGGRAVNMAEKWELYQAADDGAGTTFNIPSFTRAGTQTRVFNPKSHAAPLNTPDEDRLEATAREMYAAFDEWRQMSLSEKIQKWIHYRKTLPYLGVLQSVRENSRIFLTDSNTIELGETNSILSRIIGDDDAPFVYERLGSRLNHFLIDEFQDTSRLQWNNLHPLVAESEGRGNDNLIIGDAKQSIYRFRNADPSLITTIVPQQFNCMMRGDAPRENTNWRSSRRIVEFNNLFFRNLTKELSEDSDKPYAEGLERLYFNTVQPPSHKEDKGFIKVNICPPEKDDDRHPVHLARIPGLIAELLGRGYRQKDIAVLVDRNEDGQAVISHIMDFNRSTECTRKINFISAESLKIGESRAVQTIVSVLETVNKGSRAMLNAPEERHNKGIGDWSKLKAEFSYYAMSHPEMTLPEQLKHFLAGEYNPDSVREMLAGMSTTVLPALTANICLRFIPTAMRDAEAPFLAAFQDKVLDFCETYTSDIASFLQWWEKKGRNFSISSPENTDAVQVMTVHKSKGLEFRCVIVANSTQHTVPDNARKEWLWIKPDLSEADIADRIPWLPVETDKNLVRTPHREAYADYLRKYVTDKINMAYVAYTRAVDELYIFTMGVVKDGDSGESTAKKKSKKAPKEKTSIGDYLWDFGKRAEEILTATRLAYPAAAEHLPKESDFSLDAENHTWSIGTPPSPDEIADSIRKSEEKEAKEREGETTPISAYRCDEPVTALCFRDPAAPGEELIEEEEPEASAENDSQDEDDNRLYGELMHAIMERVRVPGDLPRAVLRMRTRGFFDRKTARELHDILSRGMESVKKYRWFEPDSRIINERGITGAMKVKRPDRIVMRADGSAAVVDYKFGTHRDDARYSRQVKSYVRALKNAGAVKECEAYIWYVSLGIVVEVSR